MNIDQANAAGALAGQVTQIQSIVDGLQRLKTNKAQCAGSAAFFDPVAGGNVTMLFPQMTAEESVFVLDGAIAIFQARLDTASKALAAL